MAGLGGNKKRNSSSNSRVSRFSEVLGAAQENVQKSGYPDTQESEQLANQTDVQKDIQKSEYPNTQPSEQLTTKQSETQGNIQNSGYPNTQTSKQSATKKTKAGQHDTQISGYPSTQQSEQSVTLVSKVADNDSQIFGYPNTQKSEQQAPQQLEVALKQPEKLPKRENPNYTQTTFRIPKKLSRQINRALMDLADEGIEMDRSDLLEELAGVFIRLSEEVGVAEALAKLKNLGTQVDE